MHLRQRALAALSVMIIAVSAAPARSLNPDRVEEDWELVIETTDGAAVGPQITTTMSPMGDNNDILASFNLNYRESPFRAGGMEMQVWHGKILVIKDSDKTQQLATDNETITWTQVMKLTDDGSLHYDIEYGQSTTWGTFGQGNNLSVEFITTLTDLLEYSPDLSATNSGAGWQSNHVKSMRIKQVRYYSDDQLLRTDSMSRSVDLHH